FRCFSFFFSASSRSSVSSAMPRRSVKRGFLDEVGSHALFSGGNRSRGGAGSGACGHACEKNLHQIPGTFEGRFEEDRFPWRNQSGGERRSQRRGRSATQRCQPRGGTKDACRLLPFEDRPKRKHLDAQANDCGGAGGDARASAHSTYSACTFRSP